MVASAHAKNRPPSAAKRWLSCAKSSQIVQMYPNEPSEESLKGDFQHQIMEDTITYGFVPATVDPDVDEVLTDLLIYVKKRISEMGKSARVYVEVSLQIPETGEFGTVDILIVGDRELEIIDYKSGYVPVNVRMNAQMMVYLCGAIALYGHKSKYKVTIHQPNYDHIDGAIRSFEPTTDDIEWIRQEIKYSMDNPDEIKAGGHCKESYCPHRGACDVFAEYTRNDLTLGWHTSEINAVDDATLAKALDAAEELSGYRNELRAEAMRRIMNLDRTIDGYKVVKGRKQRSIIDPQGLIDSARTSLGENYALGVYADSLVRLVASSVGIDKIPEDAPLGTVKQIEDLIKRYAKDTNLPRGGWKQVYDTVIGPYVRETTSGLTLEKAIDGRPAHKRGSEFGNIQAPTSSQNVSII